MKSAAFPGSIRAAFSPLYIISVAGSFNLRYSQRGSKYREDFSSTITALSERTFSESSPNSPAEPYLIGIGLFSVSSSPVNSDTESPITPSLFIFSQILSAGESDWTARVIRSLNSIANATVLFDFSALNLGIIPIHASSITAAIAVIKIFLAFKYFIFLSSIVQREAIQDPQTFC